MTRRYCRMQACKNPSVARGLCAAHYSRARNIVIKAGYSIRHISNEELVQSLIAGRLIARKQRDFSTMLSQVLEDFKKQCVMLACENPIHARGMCSRHYSQARRLSSKNGKNTKNYTTKQLVEILEKNPTRPIRIGYICAFPDCDNPHRARGLCNKHRKRASYRLKAQGRSISEVSDRGLLQLLIDIPARSRKKRGKICVAPDCNNLQRSRGLCDKHRKRASYRLKAQGRSISEVSDRELLQLLIDIPARSRKKRGKICAFPDCDNPHKARGLCSHHYSRIRTILKKQRYVVGASNYTDQELLEILKLNPTQEIRI